MKKAISKSKLKAISFKSLCRLSVFSCLISCFILAGCFETKGVDQALTEQVSGRSNGLSQANLAKIPEIKLVKGQKYVPLKRDPMENQQYVGNDSDQNHLLRTDSQPIKFDPNRPEGYLSEPLEAFNLSALKLVGTMRKQSKAFALLKDPVGVMHTAQIGDYIGNQFGRISRIETSFIEVEEKVFSLDRSANHSAEDSEKIIKTTINLEIKPH